MTRASTLSNGELVVAIVDKQLRALVSWHGPVLANTDPEPLHQMRVAMRRLRVTLRQFEPLLELPDALPAQRLAKTARRLGMARDLDVLQARLKQQLLPQLPASELEALRPVLKQLRRERQQAHAHVGEQLKGSAYLNWLAQMQRWARKPSLTPLAGEPLADWMVQWQLGWSAVLWVHPAWRFETLASEHQREQLHGLRKQIKMARYQLDNCKPLLGRATRRCLARLKAMQELLGELNDLQVLQHAIDDQLPGSVADDLPRLHALLEQSERDCWSQWRQLAGAQGTAESPMQLLVALQADRRLARLQRQWLRLCSGLQRAVFCDWRALAAGR